MKRCTSVSKTTCQQKTRPEENCYSLCCTIFTSSFLTRRVWNLCKANVSMKDWTYIKTVYGLEITQDVKGLKWAQGRVFPENVWSPLYFVLVHEKTERRGPSEVNVTVLTRKECFDPTTTMTKTFSYYVTNPYSLSATYPIVLNGFFPLCSKVTFPSVP